MGSNVKYRSGNYTLATPVGELRSESPLLPFNNEALVFKQDFEQLRDYWQALDYNTPLSVDVLAPPIAYLVDESERQDIGGRTWRWTRTWARVPDSYEMPGGIYQYQFPGFDNGREPITLPVALSIRRTFFLCGNFGVFSQWQDIPINRGLIIYDDGDITAKTDTLSASSTPSQAQYQAWVNSGTQIQIEDSKICPWRGSIFVRDDYLAVAQ